jgi:hypothetical protein
MNQNTTIAFWGLLCLLPFQVCIGQSIRTIEYFNAGSGAYVPAQKLYYGTAGSTPGQKYVNKLLKFNPFLGEVVEELAVGDDPRFLRPSTDRSMLFFVTDQPNKIKRFNIALNKVDQEDVISFLGEDQVQAVYTLPNNNEQVIILVRRDGTSSYIDVYERGQPKERYLKLSSNETEGLSVLSTQDSLVWLVSPATGSITKLINRANGFHLAKVFKGYNRSLEDNYTQVGNYFISPYGQYLDLSGDIPRVVGRLNFGQNAKVSVLPNAPFFFVMDQAYNRGNYIRKFRTANLEEIDTIKVDISDSSIRSFEACEEDLFVFQNFHVNFLWNCTSKVSKPIIDEPGLKWLCQLTDTAYVLKVKNPASQYYLKNIQ